MIAGESKKSRLLIGKNIEAQIADLLFPLFKLQPQPVSEIMDRAGVDRMVVTPRGQVKTLQIKYRETGEDILLELYDPFIGNGELGNRLGRDLAHPCHFVACLIGESLHLIHGEALRECALQALREVCFTPKTINGRTSKGVYVRSVRDPKSQIGKLLAFLPINSIPDRHVWTKNILTGKTVLR